MPLGMLLDYQRSTRQLRSWTSNIRTGEIIQQPLTIIDNAIKMVVFKNTTLLQALEKLKK